MVVDFSGLADVERKGVANYHTLLRYDTQRYIVHMHAKKLVSARAVAMLWQL